MAKGNVRDYLIAFCGIAAFALLLYTVFAYIIQEKIYREIDPYENLRRFEERLKRDEYRSIPVSGLSGCSFSVYGEDGQQLFASDDKIRNLTFQDTKFLGEFDADTYFTIYRNEATDAGGYYVIQESYDPETNTISMQGFCLVDEDYQIVEGNLFQDTKRLTGQQFDLLKGIYQDNRDVRKYTYRNVHGEERTLIFFSPITTEKQYAAIVQRANRIWLLAGGIGLVGLLLLALLFDWKIRRELRQQLKVATMQRDKLEKERQRAVADLTHDLKTPLTVIGGFAKAMMDKVTDPETQERYITAIYSKSRYTAGLLDALFEYTKLDHPEFQMHLEETDYCEYCREFLGEKYTELELKHFTMEISIPEEPKKVLLDRALYRRVLENLMDNIIKHNDAGTGIRFQVREMPEKGMLETVIEDNGKGIPWELAESIFDPFVVADTARSSGKGTGLGMAVAKKILELHGGSIVLALMEGNPSGTKMILQIPMDKRKKRER